MFREVSYSNYLFCTKIIKTIYSNLCAGAAQTLAGLPNSGPELIIIKNAGAHNSPALLALQSSELQEMRCSRQEIFTRQLGEEKGGGSHIINEWKSQDGRFCNLRNVHVRMYRQS